MARQDHQPLAEVAKRPNRKPEDMRVVCRNTIAIILALDTDTTPIVVHSDDPDAEPVECVPDEGKPAIARPLQEYQGEPAVCHAVRAAIHAQMGMVYVLTAPEIGGRVTHAAHSVKRKKSDPFVEVLECDVRLMKERTRQAADFEVFGVPYSVLEIAREFVGEGFEGFDGAVIMNADMVRITHDHLFELCQEANGKEDLDVAASWISQLRRPPYLFTQKFFSRLGNLVVAKHGTGGKASSRGFVPLPRLNVRDRVFGEEKLQADIADRKSVSQFCDMCDITALQALDQAAVRAESAGAEPASESQQNQANRMLVDAAARVLAWADSLPEEQKADVAWADEFGKGNKPDFPLLNASEHAGSLVYLDSAATTQRVGAALEAQRVFDERENANVYRGIYELSAHSTELFKSAREKIAGFIGARAEDFAFTANATASINVVAQAWGEHNIGEDDLIVTTVAEHHANMLPFIMLAQRKGAQVEFVPYGPDGHIDQAAYAEALARKPKLVCLAQIGNVLGLIEPVAEMAQAAHDVGARVLADAAQSFPHMAIDVSELGADWLAFSAHKAYGPMGIGGLWIAPEAFDEMDPLGGGGGVISHMSTDSYYLRAHSLQYEAGTPAVSQAVGWASAIDYMETLGMDNIERHSAVLTRYAACGLAQIPGVTVLGDHSTPEGQAGLVAFTVAEVSPAQLAAFLGSRGVALRSGGHCALPLHASLGLIGSGRISIGVHTTRADIDAALAAIDVCRRLYA